MTEQTELVTTEGEVPTTMLLLGAAAGALVGAAIVYAVARQRPARVRLTPVQAVKAGALMLGTLRQLAALMEESM